MPADGFYEWQATPGRQLPRRITLKDGEPFAFAGLWERWDKAPDDYAAWLGEDAVRQVTELLRPYPSEAMRAYRVSTAVNSVKNGGPRRPRSMTGLA